MLDIAARLQATAPSPDLCDQLHGLFTFHAAQNVRSVPSQYNLHKAGGLDRFAQLHLLALCEHQDADREDVRPIAGLMCGPLAEVDWAVVPPPCGVVFGARDAASPELLALPLEQAEASITGLKSQRFPKAYESALLTHSSLALS